MTDTTFSVTFVNNSVNAGDVCIYQSDPDLGVPGAMSLAWFVKRTFPGTEAVFEWEVKYNFVWSETATLAPGARFTASQKPAADLTTGNQITLDYQGAYTFINQRAGPVAGNLYVDTTGNIPLNMASVGIGMAGIGTYAVQAQPNASLIFTPHPVYWITFGNYSRGQVLNVAQINNKKQIEFPTNIFAVTAILGSNNAWTIEPAAATNKRLLEARTADAQARWGSP